MRYYLHGVHFELVTDHRPLLWLLSSKQLAGQQARWVLAVQQYDFQIRHRAGINNIADLPSRQPLPTDTDCAGTRLDLTSTIGHSCQMSSHLMEPGILVMTACCIHLHQVLPWKYAWQRSVLGCVLTVSTCMLCSKMLKLQQQCLM